MNKENRQLEIQKILRSSWINNQDELLRKLQENGYDLTQATLSRDLKEMQVVKTMHPDQGTRYVLPEESGSEYIYYNVPDQMEGVISVEFSSHFTIVKTLPGFANSVAYTIDRQKISEIMGTIAGDDTILIIKRDGISSNLLAGSLSAKFPKLANKFV